jgi:Domain of unknown function (DUF4333)
VSGVHVTRLVLLSAALAAGCGGDDTVDADQVEQGIEDSLSTATTEIQSVSCPDDVEKQEGAKFDCAAKLAGGKATVVVTQTGRNDFGYAFKPGSVQLADDVVEPAVEQALAGRGVADAQVDCPELMRVADGETATCAATGANGRTTELTFTWSDDSGTIDPASIETADET